MLEDGSNNLMLDISDYELIELIKQGNDIAFDELITRYMYLVKLKSSECCKDGLDYEDLFQEGLLGLLNAAKTFDSSSVASFTTYAGLCIQRRMYSLYKFNQRKKRVPVENLICFDENEEQIEGELLSDPEEVLIKKEEDKLRNQHIKEVLSDLEFKVLSMYVLGESYSEIAQKMNITSKKVDNALQRIRRKLR